MFPIPRPLVLTALLLTGLTACSEEASTVIEPPKPVKVEQLGMADAQVSESFVGTIRARQRADLGFEGGGKIASISAEVGDYVRAGQVLATLDPVPVQQRLAKAEADQKAASVALAERTAQLRRIHQLAQDQVVSPASLESEQAQYQAALSQAQSADAALSLARRDLALAQIKAPFDGQIVSRTAQSFADVAPGQVILQLENGKALEVVAMLPQSAAARLQPGQSVRLLLAGQAESGVTVMLDKLSARADNGSQVQAIFKLEGNTKALSSGMTVSLALPGRSSQAISIPASAVLPGQKPGEAQVFILDTDKQRLALRKVQIAPSIGYASQFPVVAGVKAGEWIVVAGVPFLSDGQAATRFIPQTRLNEVQP